MTLPDERYRSIKWAEKFLTNIANPKGYPRIPKHVRNEALSILRHFPTEYNLKQLENACPDVLQEHMEPVSKLFKQYEESNK